VGELVRGGIDAVARGQSQAGLASGLTRGQTLRLIIYPQALRIVAPSLAGLFSQLIKDSSLASVITVPELSFAASAIDSDTFRTFEVYITISVLYVVVVTIISNMVLLLPGAHRSQALLRVADA
jgi:ABC-type amino acid transport system permease subunit